MKKIDVCLSPDLIHLHDLKDRLVVVVDVLRATTCMVTALANGVSQIRTFADLSTCKSMKQHGYIIAGERGGEKVADFDLGNSPLSYLNNAYLEKKIALTTTNGTVAIDQSKEASQIIIGALVNLAAIVTYLKSQKRDVLIFCAGWKGNVNLEDTLFAGAVVNELQHVFEVVSDAAHISAIVYHHAKNNIIGHLKNASHIKRLSNFNIEEDIQFCLSVNKYDIIPVLEGEDFIIKHP